MTAVGFKLSRIELRFVPQVAALDAKTMPKHGVTEVDVANGTFEYVSTYEFGDGVVEGKHKVIAMAMDDRSALLPAIPAEYHSDLTTPLEIDTTQRTLDLFVKKP